MVMDQELISAVGYAKNGSLTNQLLLLLLLRLQIPLPPQLQDLPMRIRVLRRHKRRARRRPVLRHQPPGLVPDSTSIAQSLRTQRASAPLRRLLGGTVQAFPT